LMGLNRLHVSHSGKCLDGENDSLLLAVVGFPDFVFI
jgi:hypothetical protein